MRTGELPASWRIKSEELHGEVSSRFRIITSWAERLLAAILVAGVVIFAVGSIPAMSKMDWGRTETLYELIYRILLLVIALELVRTLVTHDLIAILELLAFVIARKMLKPDLTATDILISVLAFVALLAARWFLAAVVGRSQPPGPSP